MSLQVIQNAQRTTVRWTATKCFLTVDGEPLTHPADGEFVKFRRLEDERAVEASPYGDVTIVENANVLGEMIVSVKGTSNFIKKARELWQSGKTCQVVGTNGNVNGIGVRMQDAVIVGPVEGTYSKEQPKIDIKLVGRLYPS